MTRLGPIARLNEGVLATLDYSSGELHLIAIEPSLLLKSRYFTDGRNATYDLRDGSTLVVHAMAVDSQKKMLFVAGQSNRSSVGSTAGLHIFVSDFNSQPVLQRQTPGKDTLAPLEKADFFKGDTFRNPQVTAVASRNGQLFVAVKLRARDCLLSSLTSHLKRSEVRQPTHSRKARSSVYSLETTGICTSRRVAATRLVKSIECPPKEVTQRLLRRASHAQLALRFGNEQSMSRIDRVDRSYKYRFRNHAAGYPTAAQPSAAPDGRRVLVNGRG